jgi:hypothetical protein
MVTLALGRDDRDRGRGGRGGRAEGLVEATRQRKRRVVVFIQAVVGRYANLK